MLILGEMQQNGGARGRRVAGGREFRKNRDNGSVFCGGRAELQGWPESSRMLGVHKRYSNSSPEEVESKACGNVKIGKLCCYL